jgi:hypothetical protein
MLTKFTNRAFYNDCWRCFYVPTVALKKAQCQI